MKLLSCTLTGFGKLYRRSYTFSDGIHVIYGHNESGKTTLCTFLTAMLFGLERKRGIAAKKDEFHRYQPSEGGIYGGTLSIADGDACYQIQRNFADVSDITVYNEKNGRKVLTGCELSGKLFSMTKEAYRQTLCISQGEIRTDQSLTKMLNHYLTNMSRTKSKEVNVDRALAYLRAELRELKKESNNRELEDIRQKLAHVEDREPELERLREQSRRLQEQLDGLQGRKTLWERIIDWIRKLLGLTDRRQMERQKLEYEKELLRYQTEQLEKEQEVNEELRLRYVNIKDKRKKIEYNKKLIEDAMRAITEAAEEVHEEFGSEFQERVSSIVKELTDGTYERIHIDDSMGIVAEKDGSFLDIDFLSTGTIEQIYFAVRLAAAEVLFPEERFPIMLDDVFGNFDNIRLKQALQYLAGLNRQIFIFSCRKEVIHVLEEMKCRYQFIEA